MRTQKQLTGSIGVSPSKGALRQARRAAEYTPMPAAWLRVGVDGNLAGTMAPPPCRPPDGAAAQ